MGKVCAVRCDCSCVHAHVREKERQRDGRNTIWMAKPHNFDKNNHSYEQSTRKRSTSRISFGPQGILVFFPTNLFSPFCFILLIRNDSRSAIVLLKKNDVIRIQSQQTNQDIINSHIQIDARKLKTSICFPFPCVFSLPSCRLTTLRAYTNCEIVLRKLLHFICFTWFHSPFTKFVISIAASG